MTLAPQPASGAPARKSGRWTRPAAALGFVLVLMALGRVVPLGAWLESGSSALRDAGWRGALLLMLAYSAGALLFVPAAMFTCVAGFTYGAFWGVLLSIPGVATSSLLIFLLSRTILRDYVERWLSSDARFVVIDRLLARFGARAVVLLRFSPISPFSLLNYAFGMTAIPTRHYFLATCVGTIPGSIFFAQLGAVAPNLKSIAHGRLPEGGRAETVFLLVGITLTLVVAVWLGRLAKRAMTVTLAPAVSDDPPPKGE